MHLTLQVSELPVVSQNLSWTSQLSESIQVSTEKILLQLSFVSTVNVLIQRLSNSSSGDIYAEIVHY